MLQNDLVARAQRVLAGGPGTLSKSPSRFPLGMAPLFLEQGDGVTVWDTEGRAWLDCIGALGPVLLGHAHPRVTEAVRQQAGMLASSSMSTRLEVEVAERLVEIIPGAEQVRFATNGADVTNAAIKLARYVTGKQHIIMCGYHGQHDSYLITTDKAGGILPQIQAYNHQVKWGDKQGLQHALLTSQKGIGATDLAAIMIEVPPEPYGRALAETKQTILWYQNAAKFNNALFILDEVVTGFRYGLGGAQSYYGIQADLVCLSKALGNGYPIAVLTGPRDLMRAFEGGQVFLSTTYGASSIGLAACQAVLETLPHEYPALEEHGGHFASRCAAMLASWALPVTFRGMHGRLVLDWQACDAATAAQLKTLWMQEMLSHGMLVGVVFLPMTAWQQDTVLQLLAAVQSTCKVMAEVVTGKKAIGEALRCPVVEEVFQRYGVRV